jgi:hypothetical protein
VRGRFVLLAAAAELARQLKETGQAQLIRAEADFRPAVVLGDGGHDRQVLPGREPGDQACEFHEVFHARHGNSCG